VTLKQEGVAAAHDWWVGRSTLVCARWQHGGDQGTGVQRGVALCARVLPDVTCLGSRAAGGVSVAAALEFSRVLRFQQPQAVLQQAPDCRGAASVCAQVYSGAAHARVWLCVYVYVRVA
jgi:hypothetical protein